MPECDNILLNTLDFVLGVLNNHLMILILNIPGFLHLVTDWVLRVEE